MKNKTLIFALIISSIMLSSCARIIYSTDAYARAHSHKNIAIIPPNVVIQPNKPIAPEVIREQQKVESLNFQKAMYDRLQKMKSENKIFVDVMNIETTNQKLKKDGYFDEPLTPDQICSILKVDGIITSEYILTQPLSKGAAIGIGCLLSLALFNPAWIFVPPTNKVIVAYSLYDKETKKSIFSYNHQIASGILSTPDKIVNIFLKRSSKKAPYIIQ